MSSCASHAESVNPPAATRASTALGYLEVQPVEPFQTIDIGTGGADGLESLENVRDGLWEQPGPRPAG